MRAVEVKAISHDRFYKKTAFCILLFSLFMSTFAQAKEEDEAELSVFGEMGFEYTDNVFGLTDDRIATMDENDPDDILSGRYKDMDSLSDSIFEPRVGLKWKSDSPLGGKLRLTSWLRYHFYLENDALNYPEYGMDLRNSIGEKGTLGLDVDIINGFQKKNYLSSANDINENGNISRDERIYSAAVYDEYQGSINYRHEIVDDKDAVLSRFFIKPFTGYSTRSHNSSLKNRDRDIVFGGLGLDFEFMESVDLELLYRYENVSSPDDIELVLFDERISGYDVSGDGLLKKNAPIHTNIDRSSERNTITVRPSITLTKEIKFSLEYSNRTTRYTSDNPLDTEHYGQKAYEEKFKAEIDLDLSKSWRLKAEYCRTDDEDPEDGIYNENSYLFVLRYSY